MSIRRLDWLAVLLAVGAGLHAAAVTTHLEYVPYVAFFAGTAVLGAAAAVLLVARPTLSLLRPLLVAGNVALVGVWLLTRTAGAPIGPEAGLRHQVGLHDALAAGTALAVVLALVLNSTRGSRSRSVRPPARLRVRVGVLGAIVGLAAWGGVAIAEPAHGPAHGPTDGHDSGHHNAGDHHGTSSGHH